MAEIGNRHGIQTGIRTKQVRHDRDASGLSPQQRRFLRHSLKDINENKYQMRTRQSDVA
jgi:hypothetical protein